jgi:hypothetical protein
MNVVFFPAKEQLEEVNHDFEVAKIAVEAERKKREEVEEMYSELLKDKHEFDEKMAEINEMLEVAISGTSGIQKHTEQYREKEQSLVSRVSCYQTWLCGYSPQFCLRTVVNFIPITYLCHFELESICSNLCHFFEDRRGRKEA